MSSASQAVVARLAEPVQRFDERFSGVSPSKIAAGSLLLAYLAGVAWRIARHGVWDTAEDIKLAAFAFIRKYFGKQFGIDSAIADAKKGFLHDFAKKQEGVDFLHARLPPQPVPRSEVLALCKKLAELNVDVGDGTCSGCIYADGGDGYKEFLAEAMQLHQETNPLQGGHFSGVRKMEAEVISMVVNMFNGGPRACGAMTTGGTESILLAVKAYRDYGKKVMGITSPEIVMPVTAHGSFDKGCDYFGLKLRKARMDPKTCKVDLAHMWSLVNSNTVCLVASAPHFPHGVIDPVEAIAEYGLKRGIPVHVDCCLGGFLLPFMEKAGCPLDEKFDFRVPGVTSISCDVHKYGMSPKGSSIIMYSTPEMRHYQMHACTDWPGGIYATPTMAGTRIGGVVAGAWASLMANGEAGYVESTRKIVEAVKYCRQELEKVPGIRVMGNPMTCVVAFTSDEFDIYRLLQYLLERKWSIGPLQFPTAVHMCFTANHTKDDMKHTRRFVEDVKKGVAEMLRTKDESATGMAALYGTTQTVSDRTIVGDVCRAYFDAYYEVDLAKHATSS
eukprot:TRINITY_DN4671_c0_g1_i1.p1 TRINITY_DN4671_c0_g1~~TRINITY_DN4671_c0_g1_i1.p1  ORF type:complete len:558 (+),score=220.02 TRINITY_DN4671_c0_g1_i1:55-1728(+)